MNQQKGQIIVLKKLDKKTYLLACRLWDSLREDISTRNNHVFKAAMDKKIIWDRKKERRETLTCKLWEEQCELVWRRGEREFPWL